MQSALAAEDQATLIADFLEITGENTLRASGNVEVLYQGARLMAQELSYDRRGNALQIKGAIRLDDGRATTILASEADLSDDLRNGLILGAQLIIDQQLQLTASAIQRVDGRYNTLYQTAASSCQICNGRVPLWEIRAKRIVHDTEEKQIYFDQAQFRIGGVPLAYFPKLRLADPTLERATGFLVPKAEVSSSLGLGLKMPYFINIAPDKDLTLTPFFTTQGARSIDLRYRQAFRAGTLTINGALSQDRVIEGELRGYLLASGSFDLPHDYKLRLRAETVSDSGYFRGYGLDEQDRFVTSLQVDRANRDTFVQGRVLGFYSVRSDESNTTQPSQIADFVRSQRIDLGRLGEAELTAHAALRQRASSNPLDGSDADSAADGRDVRGYGLRADWQNGATLPFGVLLSGAASLRADTYRVDQDADFAGQYSRTSAALAGQLRWPLVKTDGRGGVHTIEPIAQIVLAPSDAQRLFNEDSALVEFDEGNLFAINRFAGSDQIETSNRANLGVTYSYTGTNSQRGQLAFGRVISASDTAQFAKASGLGQAKSDWLVAGQLHMDERFDVSLRSLVTDAGDLRKLELRGAVNSPSNSLTLGYLFAPADDDEQRASDISEITATAKQNITDRWKTSLSTRYDDVAGQVSRAGAAVTFRNECLQVDVSLSRNFASSSSVEDNTIFGLSVALLGFGGQNAGKAAQCRG